MPSAPGPPMTLGNMRSLGVRSLAVTCVKDSIAAAQRSGLKSKGDIASYVAQDPSVRAIARQSDGQLDMAALAQAFAHERAFGKIWESPVR